MLIDTGPLVACIDRNEPDHRLCVETLKRAPATPVTTAVVLTEAMYLLGRVAGWSGQELLWRLVLRGDLELAPLDPSVLERARDLMHKYRDLPMDLADATLVAVAEANGFQRIFTLDNDFRVYRLHGKSPFEVVP